MCVCAHVRECEFLCFFTFFAARNLDREIFSRFIYIFLWISFLSRVFFPSLLRCLTSRPLLQRHESHRFASLHERVPSGGERRSRATHFSTSPIHSDSMEKGKSFEIFHVFRRIAMHSRCWSNTFLSFIRFVSFRFVRLLEFVEIGCMQKHREKVK